VTQGRTIANNILAYCESRDNYERDSDACNLPCNLPTFVFTLSAEEPLGLEPVPPPQNINANIQPQQPAYIQPQQNANVQPQQPAYIQPQQNANVQPQQPAYIQPQQNVNVQPQQNVNVQPQQNVNVQPQQNIPPPPQNWHGQPQQMNVAPPPPQYAAVVGNAPPMAQFGAAANNLLQQAAIALGNHQQPPNVYNHLPVDQDVPMPPGEDMPAADQIMQQPQVPVWRQAPPPPPPPRE